MQLAIGQAESHIHQFVGVDDTGKVVYDKGWACNMLLRMSIPFDKNVVELCSSLRAANGLELKDFYSFLDYLFSKEHSPYRKYLDYIELVRDDKGHPQFIRCTDLDKTCNLTFCCMVASARLAYECPGSTTVFGEALKLGAEPHVAYIAANILSATYAGTFNVTKLVLSPYATGWHTPLTSGGIYCPAMVKNPKVISDLDFRSVRSNRVNHSMSYLFSSNDVKHLKIEELYSVNDKEYKGMFVELYNSLMRKTDYEHLREKKLKPLKEIIELISSKC